MADVFLSYAREDRDCAEQLARALAGRGWSVWWDRRIQVGRSFSEIIERELDEANCVVVIWSRHSLASEWVQNEAAEAARRKALVPVRIEDVRLPLEFRRLQTADLLNWRNGFAGPEWNECLMSIEERV
ncbi:MAG TPA: toll/interleukin-1 receptor domain-containing protein, partial [Thermoanaerobaculia bacterium]|nr:toll/interleukin-1 receptor domain-containing protein [Thermoanaerobaculia bacterium]